MEQPGSVGATSRKLFRQSGADEFMATPEAPDLDEKMTDKDKADVAAMLDSFREEVKEMERTAWLYEDPNPQAITKI